VFFSRLSIIRGRGRGRGTPPPSPPPGEERDPNNQAQAQQPPQGPPPPFAQPPPPQLHMQPPPPMQYLMQPPSNQQAMPIPPNQGPLFQGQVDLPPGVDPVPMAANLLANMQQQQNQQRDLMEAALLRLGLSQAAAREFTNNGITSLERLWMLTQEGFGKANKANAPGDTRRSWSLYTLLLPRVCSCSALLV